MKKPFYLVVFFALVMMGCGDDDKIAKEINRIPVNLKISRFDNEFANASASDIPKLREEYPYLFPAPDSVWISKLEDSLQIELRGEVKREFSQFDSETAEIELLFKHIKYYFPKYELPKIITVTNNVDYNNRIILADSLLLIGLDNYLGPDHKYYSGMQNYIAQDMNRDFMVSNIANAFANKVVPRTKERTFLAQIIYYGKVLYLKDKLIPFQTDAQKITYSEDELAWAQANEEPIWRYFIERELLYSTDNNLALRFLDPAPFSKFGLELDNESPGRIGRYMGWRIVRSFMEKNEVSLQQLLAIPAEEIFKKSNYKPN
ncbi:MAG: gliding motility lipoprotein GldB [Maribacter sp.]